MNFDFEFAVLVTIGIPLIAMLIALIVPHPKEFLAAVAIFVAAAVVFIISGLIGARLH